MQFSYAQSCKAKEILITPYIGDNLISLREHYTDHAITSWLAKTYEEGGMEPTTRIFQFG